MVVLYMTNKHSHNRRNVRLVLVDFNAAKILEVESTQLARRSRIGGFTEEYAAPEVLREMRSDSGGRGREHKRSDIFSLGCIFHFVVTKKAPFAMEQLLRTMPSVPSFDNINDGHFTSLLNNMLQWNWADRPRARQLLNRHFFEE